MTCYYYNQGLFIGASPQGETRISMCCWQQKKTVDIVHFDHEYLVDIRKQGQTHLPEVCSTKCSMPGHIANERERAMTEWPMLIGSDTTTLAIKTLHLEQSLICNLKCISCSSKYSSAWNGDYQEFDNTAPNISLRKMPESAWKHLDLSQLNRIHFTGGEPLLNRDNKKILQHLDSLGKLSEVILNYNTNGTVRPDSELLNLWKRCKFVRLFVSLDGVGSTFEYTRFPANWQEVQHNLQYFRSLNDICILIEPNAIVGIHNLFNLPEFFNWVEQYCQNGSQGDPSHVFVRRIESFSYGGKVLDLKHLPEHLSKKAIDMLKNFTSYDGVNGLILYIKTFGNPNNSWIDYLDRLDIQRKTDWKNSLNPTLLS